MSDSLTSVTNADENRRQVLYWRLLAHVFGTDEQPSLEAASMAVIDDLGLPAALLDPSVSIDTLVQRFPELGAELRNLMAQPENSTVQTENSTVQTENSTVQTENSPAQTGSSAAQTGSSAAQTGSSANSTTRPDGSQPGAALPAEAAAEATGENAGEETGETADEQARAEARAETRQDGVAADEPIAARAGAAEVRRAALVSKVLLNVFSTGAGNVTATQLACWQSDAGWFEQAMGCQPGELRGRAGSGELAGVLAGLEGDLVRRMKLREVLADPQLARQLTPSMSLVEQLLRDKHNLSGVALANAKALIRRFVDEVAEVLRTQVEKTSVGTIDRSVPPKRVFRNLDLQRTIWKNLTNWSQQDERLYVDQLFYKHTARRTTPARLIVVVDQSGSMIDAMVNCTILASIFAGLPKVDVHLVAYDTRALDLTPWVHDPFEVLLRTKLGGGTDGTVAMALARPKITDPRNTVMVWISDFYDNRDLYRDFEAIYRSGVKFIPVGSVNSSGYQSVDPWFRERLKDMGTPVISGHIRKLVAELKNFLT